MHAARAEVPGPMIGKLIKKVLRAAVAQPWEYMGEGAPDDWEFRVSPDGKSIAIWEPGNEPWFVITGDVKGRWVSTRDMERHAADWRQFVSVEDPDD